MHANDQATATREIGMVLAEFAHRHARNEGRTVRDLAAEVLRGGLDL